MTAYNSFKAVAAVHQVGACLFDSDSELDANAACALIMSADLDGGSADDYAPGGFHGAMGYARDSSAPYRFEMRRTFDEPLVQNLGPAELFQVIRQDIIGLRSIVESLSPASDPGDLAGVFSLHL
jgi:hypothetical protein